MKKECLNFKFKRTVRGCAWVRMVEVGTRSSGNGDGGRGDNREKRERHSGGGGNGKNNI